MMGGKQAGKASAYSHKPTFNHSQFSFLCIMIENKLSLSFKNIFISILAIKVLHLLTKEVSLWERLIFSFVIVFFG